MNPAASYLDIDERTFLRTVLVMKGLWTTPCTFVIHLAGHRLGLLNDHPGLGWACSSTTTVFDGGHHPAGPAGDEPLVSAHGRTAPLASIGYSLGGYIAAIMGTGDLCRLARTLGAALYPVEWLIAMLASCLLGLLVGIPALRLRGIYLALATIAFVQVLNVVVLVWTSPAGRWAFSASRSPSSASATWFCWATRYRHASLLLASDPHRGRLILHGHPRGRTGRSGHGHHHGAEVRAFLSSVAAWPASSKTMARRFPPAWNARARSGFRHPVACLAYVLIGGARSIWVTSGCDPAGLARRSRPLKDARLIMNGIVLVSACIYLPQDASGLASPCAIKFTGVA